MRQGSNLFILSYACLSHVREKLYCAEGIVLCLSMVWKSQTTQTTWTLLEKHALEWYGQPSVTLQAIF